MNHVLLVRDDYMNYINEGFFNKTKISHKNCLPIDITKTYNQARIMCINGHYLTGLQQAFQSSGVRYGLLASIFGGIIFGGIGTVPGLAVLLKSLYDWTVYPLIRQHNARDFVLLPIIKEENIDKINNIYNQFNDHPVLSINDGKVIKVINNISNDGHYGPAEGNYIIISHYDNSFFSLYGHLYQDSIIVQEGDNVKKGQKIASVGNTGNSEIPHLHFEITYQNPDNYFSWGKNMVNFEYHMYTPINISKILISYMKNNEDGIMNEFKKKLILNKSGEISSFCLLT